MKVPYYPGCTLKKVASSFEISAVETAKLLGIELIELPKWYCCGALFPMPKDRQLRYVPTVRTLLGVKYMRSKGIIEREENRLITLCNECYNVLSRVNMQIRADINLSRTISELIGEEYDGSVRPMHYLKLLEEIGFNKVAENVRKPLKGLKVAPYYGCLLLKPRAISIDDPEDPNIMERLFNALGAEVIKSTMRTKCCGAHLTIYKPDIVVELVHEILSSMIAEGANIVAVTCPLCFFNLSYRQKNVKESYPEFKEIPVVYFTQLMAFALGLERNIHGIES